MSDGRHAQPDVASRDALTPLSYLRDPQAIYERSFAMARAEADLARVPAPLRDVAVRLVHASGMPDIVADLDWRGPVAERAREALAGGAPVLADCQMVAHGVIASRLPASNRITCTLGDPCVPERAREAGTTRSAAAVERWGEQTAGAVVAIGNAPTALFRLIELLLAGDVPAPAAVLAFPVGFVGAAESKRALVEWLPDQPALTLHGRRGGSALAAAAVNALAAPGP